MYIHIYKYICMWAHVRDDADSGFAASLSWRAWPLAKVYTQKSPTYTQKSPTMGISLHLFHRDSHSPLRNLLHAARISILLWVSNSNGRVRASWRKAWQARVSWLKCPANVRVFLTQSLNKLRCMSFMSVAIGLLKAHNSFTLLPWWPLLRTWACPYVSLCSSCVRLVTGTSS